MNRHIILLLAVMVLVSCAQNQARIAPKLPISPAGRVSFRFLDETDTGGKEDSKGWEYQSPRLIGNSALPIYPQRPLAARFGKAVVIVRVTLDSKGNVTDVTPRPGSTEGPFAEDFFQAVEAAVYQWKFTPPAWWRLEEGNDLDDDGKPDYQRVVQVEQVSVYGDVEFHFDLTGNQGSVRSSAAI